MTETVGSSAWLRRVFEEEARDDLFAGHAPQEQPVLVLLGGQPAAGKTRAQHAILAELCEPGGVQFMDFGIDPDFNHCIDGLVWVDVSRIKPHKRARYIGLPAGEGLATSGDR